MLSNILNFIIIIGICLFMFLYYYLTYDNSVNKSEIKVSSNKT